jgi:peptide deformylase
MSYRTIKTEGNPILRKKSRKVEKFDDRLFELLDDMKETLYKADGVGLAAVQVGVLKRVIVIDVSETRDNLIEMINPEIIEKDGQQEEYEGCLSIPDMTGKTKRPNHVVCRYQDRKGDWYQIEGEGLLARCICHETDHLDGILFSDRLAEGETLHYSKSGE